MEEAKQKLEVGHILIKTVITSLDLPMVIVTDHIILIGILHIIIAVINIHTNNQKLIPKIAHTSPLYPLG